ncbi:MAG: TOBE domain-containing protein, partial [Alphaproteobacteria bacterium]
RAGSGSGPGDAGVAATIEEIAFEGPSVRCLLRTAGGVSFAALLPSGAPRPDGATLERGSTIVATFDERAVRLLPVDDGGAGSEPA